jgi:outer membrane protein assembly factor BamD (BamD/ComL family)
MIYVGSEPELLRVTHRRRIGGLLAALVLVTALGRPASGQERLRLDPQTGKFHALPSADPATPQGQLQAIRALIAKEEYHQARRLADDWIDTYPNHPLLVEARLLRGDARVGSRDYYKALFDYEKVLQESPSSDQFPIALEREYQIAQMYMAGVKRKLLGMAIVPAEDEAVEILIRIQERAPGSDIGESASLRLAEYYLDEKDMPQAADAYDMFLINYPHSLRREQAMERLIEATMASYKGPRFDDSGLKDAGERIRKFAKEFPAAAERIGAEALQVRITEGLALKAFYDAQWYVQRGQSLSAVYVFQRVVHDFPHTVAAREALTQLAGMGAPPVPPPLAGSTSAPASRPQEPEPTP